MCIKLIHVAWDRSIVKITSFSMSGYNAALQINARVRVLEQAAEAAEGLAEDVREECRRKDLLLVARVREIDGLEKRVVEVERENEEMSSSIVLMKAIKIEQAHEIVILFVRITKMNGELRTANERISDLELYGVHQTAQLETALSQITQFKSREVEQAQDLTSVRYRLQELAMMERELLDLKQV
jgi:hypothetical protein